MTPQTGTASHAEAECSGAAVVPMGAVRSVCADRAGAADRLGLKPTTLETRMAKLGLKRPSPA